jgi:hypothetical protein
MKVVLNSVKMKTITKNTFKFFYGKSISKFIVISPNAEEANNYGSHSFENFTLNNNVLKFNINVTSPLADYYKIE